ncbi:MAG TPA: DUF2842 domain-containing protein [Caulobacteraceae bacterium]|nr:DUF2842 domain-containing protein [Caulobacteraceae bacterium]
MSASIRKAIGSVAILVFLCLYVWGAIAIGVRLPDQWAVRLAYYAIVGMAWGVPLIPLIAWMNREP